MFCSYCGKELKDDWVVCPYCGRNVKMAKTKFIQKEKRNKRTDLFSHWWIWPIIAIAVFLFFSCVSSEKETSEEEYTVGETQNVNEETSSVQNDNDSIESMTIEEYLQSCTVVTTEDIARNPSMYINRRIAIEDSVDVFMDAIIIGMFDGTGGLEVHYEGKQAINTQGQIVGNVISGDYCCVAGVFRGEDEWGNNYMDGEIIIILSTE